MLRHQLLLWEFTWIEFVPWATGIQMRCIVTFAWRLYADFRVPASHFTKYEFIPIQVTSGLLEIQLLGGRLDSWVAGRIFTGTIWGVQG